MDVVVQEVLPKLVKELTLIYAALLHPCDQLPPLSRKVCVNRSFLFEIFLQKIRSRDSRNRQQIGHHPLKASVAFKSPYLYFSERGTEGLTFTKSLKSLQ